MIGCGPSLTRVQLEWLFDSCIAWRTISVNDAFLWAPWATLSYAADAKWHGWMSQGVDKPALDLTAEQVRLRWESFAGQKCSIESAQNYITDERVHLLRNRDSDVHGMGLSSDPEKLATGRNSGAQAVNIAVLAGATTILLLGIDGGPINGKTHFHGAHPKAANDDVWPYVHQSFAAIAKEAKRLGVRIVNCSLASAINVFEKMPIEDALQLEFV